MHTHHDKTHVTWWQFSTEIYPNQYKLWVIWSPTPYIEKKMSKIKEVPFTDNYCKLKKVNHFKPPWKSLIVAFTKIIKWVSPFLVTSTTCKLFPGKWLKIITTPITLDKTLLFVVLEISIMMFFIKQSKDSFLSQNKKSSQPNLSNQLLFLEFLH